MKKERVDVLLVERGLIETREKAKRSIMAGLVFTGTERIDKPGMKIENDADLTVKGSLLPYVGRGGLKLEKALKVFSLDVTGKIVLDIGASTGGFTDCALQNGAKYVYALDVGYNQLAWKLRNDERVGVMERTNFRHVTPDMLQEGMPDVATADVSFISLRLILPVLKSILKPGGQAVVLIKPQFEAGREEVGKKGIVRDPAVHERVITEMLDFSVKEGYTPLDLSFSPITGGDGNIEFLLHLLNGPAEKSFSIDRASEVVKEAHLHLKKERTLD
ncbi:TlyA family RNA methyltransferase [Fictibacillus aquaticus]|uniref:TlyA family rRNA (Cytidine-2'-O)-methyltransferase n=1 Tax=Fictibacillus aquaticus TaxID=2021314 RepID=A0A235FBM3_9BACL|nr:TlyA family RNA methyltransferase [Fictibacillus aquaticus]OYD58333.1 TlyA family rRNA (cytidine-2'-O)-methyltransferase [Fictibacillus aquaticus]